jgi:hypothetical protein
MRPVFISVCAALVSTSMASAQGAGRLTHPIHHRSSGRTTGGAKVTLTGCIQKASDLRNGGTSNSGNTGSSGGGASSSSGLSGEFVLITGSTSNGAATPMGNAAASAGSSTTYQLTSSQNAELARNIGKRVEIVGMLSSNGTAGTSGVGGNSSGGSGGDDATSGGNSGSTNSARGTSAMALAAAQRTAPSGRRLQVRRAASCRVPTRRPSP